MQNVPVESTGRSTRTLWNVGKSEERSLREDRRDAWTLRTAPMGPSTAAEDRVTVRVEADGLIFPIGR